MVVMDTGGFVGLKVLFQLDGLLCSGYFQFNLQTGCQNICKYTLSPPSLVGRLASLQISHSVFYATNFNISQTIASLFFLLSFFKSCSNPKLLKNMVLKSRLIKPDATSQSMNLPIKILNQAEVFFHSYKSHTSVLATAWLKL